MHTFKVLYFYLHTFPYANPEAPHYYDEDNDFYGDCSNSSNNNFQIVANITVIVTVTVSITVTVTVTVTVTITVTITVIGTQQCYRLTLQQGYIHEHTLHYRHAANTKRITIYMYIYT